MCQQLYSINSRLSKFLNRSSVFPNFIIVSSIELYKGLVKYFLPNAIQFQDTWSSGDNKFMTVLIPFNAESQNI